MMDKEEKNGNREGAHKKAQELYMELRMLSEQIQEVQKQIGSFEENVTEVNESKKGLNELSEIECGKEILVPIVSGIFVKAEIKETKEFIVNVGANVAVTKSIEEVQKLLSHQLDQVQNVQNELIEGLQNKIAKAKTIEAQLKKIID